MSAPIESNSTPPEDLRRILVEKLLHEGVLCDAEVERALRTVPRHLFLPAVSPEHAYADNAVLTHEEDGMPVSSASQPAIVAIMLQQLAIAPGMRVLEVGAGTGYNAALLAELVGPSGHVTTIDISDEIAAEARAHLDSAGYSQVEVNIGDGAAGWPANAPYDRIELTVGANDMIPAWYEQLAENGLITLPLSLGISDASVAFRKRDGSLRSESLTPCGFMRLRGSEQSATQWVSLDNGLRLGSDEAVRLAEPVKTLLATRPRWKHLSFDGTLVPWLGLRGLRLVVLSRDPRRRWLGHPRVRYGVYAEGPDGPSLSILASRMPILVSFGGTEAERQVVEETARWQATRTIPWEQWLITAWPHYSGIEPPQPPADVHRQTRRYFTYDIKFG